MKKTLCTVLAFLICFTLIFTLLSCDNTDVPPISSNDDTTGELDNSNSNSNLNKDEDSPYKIVRKFVENYNMKSSDDIENTKEFIYEHRLNAFDGAYAIQGYIGENFLTIINYGVYSKDSIRITGYVDSIEEATEIIVNTIGVLDSTVTTEEWAEIQEEIASDTTGNYINDISYYCIHNYRGNNFEIFIDCSNIDFAS